jgi:endonuclease/exonuclease/phosphatase family metal-dependent hydrolase
MGHRLRVATLNLWNRSGPWSDRLALIRYELRRLLPDVIGLQEVLRRVPPGELPDGVWSVANEVPDDGIADQASVVAAGTHGFVAYARAMDYGSGLAFGNAVASRYPIVDHEVFALPGEETGEGRSLLYALVEHPAGRLPVFVTHLNWKLHHGSVRLRQVRFICDRVRELAPTGADEKRLPPVLMGDFNAAPDADEIRYLTGLATVDGSSVYFADAWVYGGDDTPGYTFDRKNRFAALAHEPPRRIDYIFVRGPDSKLRGEPLETRLAFAESVPGDDGPLWPSDHFGLVTDLSVEPQSWG